MNWLNYLFHDVDSWSLLIGVLTLIALIFFSLKTGIFSMHAYVGLKRDEDPIGFWVRIFLVFLCVLAILGIFLWKAINGAEK